MNGSNPYRPRIGAAGQRVVDLGKIQQQVRAAERGDAEWDHWWVLTADFRVSLEDMERLVGLRDDAIARGDTEIAAETPVMGPDSLVKVDGPGCGKCMIHWAGAEGWGTRCDVSDGDWEKATGRKVPREQGTTYYSEVKEGGGTDG